jgi:CheY-like chemotaxis protein
VARALLGRLGCEVEVAASGEEALRLLEDRRFDLVPMDCMMPGLDGYGTTAEIRRREGAGSRTPIVAMTASAAPVLLRHHPETLVPPRLASATAVSSSSSRIVRELWP